jgi:hypothetical protein
VVSRDGFAEIELARSQPQFLHPYDRFTRDASQGLWLAEI